MQTHPSGLESQDKRGKRGKMPVQKNHAE